MMKEFSFIENLIETYPRSQNQINRPFHSDAEIFLDNDTYVCSSVDTLSEEFTLGLLRDPFTLGWVTATASISDLAAVGCPPRMLSVVLSGRDFDRQFTDRYFQGVSALAAEFDCKVSERKTEKGFQKMATCVAVGTLNHRPPFQRSPLSSGDVLYVTGPLGWGNTTAFANVVLRPQDPDLAIKLDESYRPRPRIKEALFLAPWATACMDTSDGGLFTFHQLAHFNRAGICIEYRDELFHATVKQLCGALNLPPWLFFAAQNGEFELLFSISSSQEREFLKAAQNQGFQFLRVGHVTDKTGLTLNDGYKNIKLEMSAIENLLYDNVDAQKYILALLAFAESNQIGKPL